MEEKIDYDYAYENEYEYEGGRHGYAKSAGDRGDIKNKGGLCGPPLLSFKGKGLVHFDGAGADAVSVVVELDVGMEGHEGHGDGGVGDFI